jgi:hypothetical protein
MYNDPSFRQRTSEISIKAGMVGTDFAKTG